MGTIRLALILLVVAAMPVAAIADGDTQRAVSPSASSPADVPPDAPDPAMMQSMELRMRAQMETMVGQMRASQLELRRNLLAVLTPQQRAFVGTTVGELAVSAQRDDAAAAGRIDAALSPAQRQAVLKIVAANVTRRTAEFQNLAQQNQPPSEGPPALAQSPSGPAPKHIETKALAEPIAAGVGGPFMPYGNASQTSAGGAILSALEMPVQQIFSPPVMIMTPH